MAKLNVLTLLQADRTFDDELLSNWERFTSTPNPGVNHKVLCDNRLDEDCLRATIKWAQEETKPAKVDPLFKHLVPETHTQIKTFEVRVWFWKNSSLLLAFTDSRVKLHEVQDGLQELLGMLVRRVGLGHETLQRLLANEAVENVYELEFKDSNESSGVSTVTVSGHSLRDSDLFNQLVTRGQYLARLKAELVDPKGTSFLTTVSTSGLVVLSPYVGEPQVKAFVRTLVSCMAEGPHEA